jgi:hypothetical protein
MEDSENANKNFFKYVFNFDNDSKCQMLNIIQYLLLAIIPIVILNKLMSKYVPEADNTKGSLEISGEVVLQAIVMFMGLFFINRIITFVPTYSGMNYPEYNVMFNILPTLMITLSLQTKLGEKMNILVERLMDLWEGTSSSDKKKKNKKGAGQGQQQMVGQTPNQAAMNQSLYSDGTSLNSLPTNDMSMSNNNGNPMMPQQLPDYNNMYRQDTTPLVNAATPGEGFMNEPMAANSVLGGGAFGSW